MKKKSKVESYRRLSQSYLNFLVGEERRPEIRFEKYFEMRRKVSRLLGPYSIQRKGRTITIKHPKWILEIN